MRLRLLLAVPANLAALGLLFSASTDLVPGLGWVGQALAQSISSLSSGLGLSSMASFFSGIGSGFNSTIGLTSIFSMLSQVGSTFSSGGGPSGAASSLVAVAEPSSLALLVTACAAASFLVMRWRQARRSGAG